MFRRKNPQKLTISIIDSIISDSISRESERQLRELIMLTTTRHRYPVIIVIYHVCMCLYMYNNYYNGYHNLKICMRSIVAVSLLTKVYKKKGDMSFTNMYSSQKTISFLWSRPI